MTGKTKEQLLNHSTVSSSITTAVQAKKHLVKHYLLQADQDLNYNSLSLALLNLAYTAPGITALVADTICSVTILLDTIPSSMTPQKTITPTQTESTPINLGDQITSLMASIEDIHKMTETNKAFVEALTRTIDEARDELHSMTQLISSSSDELIDIPAQINNALSTIPSNSTPDTSATSHPAPPHQQDTPTPNTPYRNVLLTDHKCLLALITDGHTLNEHDLCYIEGR